MKIAPIALTPPFDRLRTPLSTGIREMAQYPDEFEQILVHTGQHYDASMAQVFFDELERPMPDVHLEISSESHIQQTTLIMPRFEPVVLDNSCRGSHLVVR
jgi:UDP-N-acetylglucosamine 2-epimerase